MALRHELDEQQLANTNMEEELSDTQVEMGMWLDCRS